MNILDNISALFTIGAKNPPSKAEEVKALMNASTISVPAEGIIGLKPSCLKQNKKYIMLFSSSLLSL